MNFLRTLFWVVVAVVAVVFAMNNWKTVTINLWGGLQADVRLPVLLAIAFLIGLVPLFIVHRATRWRLRRRLETVERSLLEAQAAILPAEAGAPLPAPATGPLSTGAV